ncbi:phage tail tape measure protein [Streptomyces sp. NPDC006638]|uniref:phage tail tape measure protein n=1 Tax=Streptomyces sp. NPDC006638 TaxID=3157183 RepID=UPI0033A3A36B
MASAMAGARLAAFAAGASILGVATGSRKTLEAARAASMGLVVVFGLAAFAAARFEKSMSEVRAVTNGSAKEMAQLGDAALAAGQATKYSATQAANAEAELARAGISTADIIGGALKGSLDLAASGQLELGESAIISAQAMNAFKMSGRDVGHIADVISAGAGKSATNVHDMGQAFRQAALLSSQTGLSLEETVGTLALFAQNALTGSDAGTSLKVMLQRLVPQSKEAKATMDAIGFSAYDAAGNFVGLNNLASEMKTSFAQLTPEARNAAMATIFGSDAVRAATILYEAGEAGVSDWTQAVNDSGYATRVAATMTDNLSGDLERLKGSFETALIQSGSGANVVLRDMTQALTSLVNWYAALNPEAQQTVTILSGVVGVSGLLAASLLLMLPRIMAVRAELLALGLTATRVRGMMMMLGRLGLVVGGLVAVSMGIDALAKKFEKAPPSVSRMSNALLDFAQKGRASGELVDAFGTDLDGLGEAVKRLADPTGLQEVADFFSNFDPGRDGGPGFDAAQDKIKSLDDALAQLVQAGATEEAAASFKRLGKAAEEGGASTAELKGLLPKYTEALTGADTQNKITAGSQKQLGDAAAMTADEMADQRSEAEQLTDSLKALNGVAISTAESEISFRSSLADLNTAVKENGHSLDVTTVKGRAVKSAFLDAASAAMDHAQAVAEQKKSQEAGNAVLEQDIAVLKRQMKAAGFSEAAVRKLISAYAQLPGAKETRIDAKTQLAMNDLETLRKKIQGTKGRSVTMTALTAAAEQRLKDLGFRVTHMKNGKVSVTIPTGPPKSAVSSIQAAIDGLRDGSVTITTINKVVGAQARNAAQYRASGGLIQRFADGGTVVHAFPVGGPIMGPGTGTSDSIPALVSNGEYVIKAASVRKYGVHLFDRLNAGRYAGGGLAGFSYTPTGAPALGGPSDAKQRYDKEVADLKAAWEDLNAALADAKKKAEALAAAEKNLAKVRKSKPTAKQLDAAQDRVADARKAKKAADAKVAAERQDVYAADAALGVKKGAKAPTSFNLAAYQKQLGASLAATEKWRANLTKIGRKGGAELQALLESMGEEGYALVNALAGASDKQFKDITEKLLKTGETAKATLADFTKQLSASNAKSAEFASDLQKLAALGLGDLAQALAAQGDAAAMELAHQAAGGGIAGVQANAAVQKNQSVLTGDDLANSLVLLSTLRGGPGRGYAELVAAGLDVGVIKGLVPRMMAQINSLPAANKGKFLSQFAGQGGGVAMARGGILDRPTAVLAAEAGVAESWIPINNSARSRGLLARTAGLMGYRMTPAARYGSAPFAGRQDIRQGDRHQTVNLYGAKQSSAEQAMDVARHMHLLG